MFEAFSMLTHFILNANVLSIYSDIFSHKNEYGNMPGTSVTRYEYTENIRVLRVQIRAEWLGSLPLNAVGSTPTLNVELIRCLNPNRGRFESHLRC